MSINQLIYLTLFICLCFWIIILLSIRLSKQKNINKVKQKKQTSSSVTKPNIKNDNIIMENNKNNSLIPSDTLLERKITYVVGTKGGIVKEGKYIILSLNKNITSFVVLLGEYPKTYYNGNTIVVKNGESITPETCPIILR